MSWRYYEYEYVSKFPLRNSGIQANEYEATGNIRLLILKVNFPTQPRSDDDVIKEFRIGNNARDVRAGKQN